MNIAAQRRTVASAVNGGKPWTEGDDAIIREACRDATATLEETALMLGRTYWSVAQRAYNLGLTNGQKRGNGTTNWIRAIDLRDRVLDLR